MGLKDLYWYLEGNARRRKWFFIPYLTLLAGLAMFLLFSKYSCIADNDGTYLGDNIFFFDDWMPACLSMQDFDARFYGGNLSRCLEDHPGSDPYFCVNNRGGIDPWGYKLGYERMDRTK